MSTVSSTSEAPPPDSRRWRWSRPEGGNAIGFGATPEHIQRGPDHRAIEAPHPTAHWNGVGVRASELKGLLRVGERGALHGGTTPDFRGGDEVAQNHGGPAGAGIAR